MVRKVFNDNRNLVKLTSCSGEEKKIKTIGRGKKDTWTSRLGRWKTREELQSGGFDYVLNGIRILRFLHL